MKILQFPVIWLDQILLNDLLQPSLDVDNMKPLTVFDLIIFINLFLFILIVIQGLLDYRLFFLQFLFLYLLFFVLPLCLYFTIESKNVLSQVYFTFCFDELLCYFPELFAASFLSVWVLYLVLLVQEDVFDFPLE